MNPLLPVPFHSPHLVDSDLRELLEKLTKDEGVGGQDWEVEEVEGSEGGRGWDIVELCQDALSPIRIVII